QPMPQPITTGSQSIQRSRSARKGAASQERRRNDALPGSTSSCPASCPATAPMPPSCRIAPPCGPAQTNAAFAGAHPVVLLPQAPPHRARENVLGVTLHGYRHSVYARIARIVCAEKSIAYAWVEVNPFAEPLPDGFLALHPFRRVPVL